MQKIALIHDPASTHAHTWKHWIESAHYEVNVIYDNATFQRAKNIEYGLVIPLITIRDYIDKESVRMKALLHFESKGARLLTPPRAIAATSDKLQTADRLHRAGLPHPPTISAEALTREDGYHMPFILKPRFGHSGHDINLIHSEAEFHTHHHSDMLVQKFIENSVCIRVIATQTDILSAYKKVPPEGDLIANIDRGARRVPLLLTKEASQLVQAAVKAFGGGLMGVDLLDSPQGSFVLEANVPFGFDTNDEELRDNLIALIKNETCS